MSGQVRQQLDSSAYLVQLVLALLRIVNGRLVAVVKQVSSSDEAITTIVARTACYEDTLALAKGLEFKDFDKSVQTISCR